MLKVCNNRRGGALIAAGVLCLVAAVLLTCYNLWDTWHARISSASALERFEMLTPLDDSLSSVDPDRPMPEVEIDGRLYVGKLVIPSQGLELPVQSGWDDAGLRVSPCRYAGSAYSGDMVIAAHNYRTHFGGLERLAEGDGIMFIDADGNKFNYRVLFVDVLASTAIDEMKDDEGWDLTLFTCTWGGASRVTVRCVEG